MILVFTFFRSARAGSTLVTVSTVARLAPGRRCLSARRQGRQRHRTFCFPSWDRGSSDGARPASGHL